MEERTCRQGSQAWRVRLCGRSGVMVVMQRLHLIWRSSWDLNRRRERPALKKDSGKAVRNHFAMSNVLIEMCTWSICSAELIYGSVIKLGTALSPLIGYTGTTFIISLPSLQSSSSSSRTFFFPSVPLHHKTTSHRYFPHVPHRSST